MTMPTYIGLLEFTGEGVKNIDESPARLDRAKTLAQSMGCELEQFYLTFGEYDAVGVVHAPDDETFAQFVLAINREGNVTSTTMKAFTEDEYRDVIEGIPE